ncbi:chain-length determining protein [Arthrobacter sp. TS-15]|uniref:chain-length determining protein n=1 Tax=Arthrobacter sp. TS-15 TaxID=2510797 RepID=UPI00115D384B|nr:chain-length determining protein [Arthrobacter sp. TS-15]TQS91531.1 chain-length determining protein [Arthrobacter sp. TS-15]
MDPIAVLKTLWHHKVFVLPVLFLTAFAAVYMYSYAPRSYEALTTYAIVNPKIPSSQEIEKDPALGALNTDNPYLRSADSSLITQVITTRLNDASTSEALDKAGLATDYKVERPSAAFLVEISAVSDSEDIALDTVRALGTRLEQELHTIQTVNGASDRYLFTSLVVAVPDKATEQFSSRLRSLIVVVVAGLVLTLGAVSLARSVESARERARTERTTSALTRKGRKRRTGEAQNPEDKRAASSRADTLSELETLVELDAPSPKQELLRQRNPLQDILNADVDHNAPNKRTTV